MERAPYALKLPPWHPWWFDEPRRAELRDKWTPAMEQTLREQVYRGILDGTPPATILAQGSMLDDPAPLVMDLKVLRDRLDSWIRHFGPEN